MGITLGVGIVVAIELINNSALSSFSSSVDFLSGKATHAVVSAYGRIAEEHFPKIWENPGVKAASPIIEVMAETLETAKEPLRFIGVDPFLDAEFRSFSSFGGDENSLVSFLAGDVPSAFVATRFMKRHGLKPGDTVTVLAAGLEKRVRILGALPDSGDLGFGDNTALVDISVAQDLFGRSGYLDRIDVIATGMTDKILEGLPKSLKLTNTESRKTTLESMLYSFQLNLAAMSLLALFVGIFLIYNFSMFSVLARREDMSLLLTLGADRRNLVGAFLTESVLLGAAGSMLGIVFGLLVAWISIERVSSTISELYFHVTVERVRLTVPVVLSGLGVGFLATFIGTGLPALEVALTPPVLGIKRQSIEDRAHSVKGFLLISGAALFLLSVLAAWASRFSIFWGFCSAFGMTLAFAFFTPSMLSPFTHHFGIWVKRLTGVVEGFLAARTVRASLSRTSIAVAALAVALAMTIGVDTMIYSFRNSVSAWLEGALQGDLYISPATTKWGHPLPDDLIKALAEDPRIEAIEKYSTYDILVQGKPAKIRVIDAGVLRERSQFHFLKGGKGAWDSIAQGGLFISESLGFKFGLDVDDVVELETPSGMKPFKVAAIVRDYSSDQGTIQIHRKIYMDFWKDDRVQSVALFLKKGISPDDVRNSIAKNFQGLDRTVVSNLRMREDILAIFDKTFAPTAMLKGVSLMVALLGIATALMAILMERSREMTVLGYLGLTPLELGKMNVYQALIMGLAAYLISLVCGLVLTYIIIHAINYRSFGWSVDVHLDPWVFAKTFFLTALACLISSLYPTYRLIRGPVSESLRED